MPLPQLPDKQAGRTIDAPLGCSGGYCKRSRAAAQEWARWQRLLRGAQFGDSARSVSHLIVLQYCGHESFEDALTRRLMPALSRCSLPDH
jgi:hypothetical protein